MKYPINAKRFFKKRQNNHSLKMINNHHVTSRDPFRLPHYNEQLLTVDRPIRKKRRPNKITREKAHIVSTVKMAFVVVDLVR